MVAMRPTNGGRIAVVLSPPRVDFIFHDEERKKSLRAPVAWTVHVVEIRGLRIPGRREFLASYKRLFDGPQEPCAGS